jgi:hypothetical protein
MRHKKIKWSWVLLLGLSPTMLIGQSLVTTSGGNASGAGNASYTIGQIAYTSVSNTTGKIEQGIQNSYSITNNTTTRDIKDPSVSCVVYPNPTTGVVSLKMNTNSNNNDVFYQLMDLNGKLLEKKRIDSNETIVDLQQYVSQGYLLTVFVNMTEINTYKIIKN